MSPLGLVAALSLAALQQDGRGVLSHAEVAVAVAGAEARVKAEYTVVGASTLDFLALRVKGQVLTVEAAFMGGAPLALEATAASLLLRAGRPFDSATVRIRYRVSGRLARIPLFVPSAPTRPPSDAVRIRVAGLAADRVSSGTLPRFVREGGAFVARGEHVPSLMALVSEPGELPMPRLADLIVLAIAVGGTGFWVVRRMRGA